MHSGTLRPSLRRPPARGAASTRVVAIADAAEAAQHRDEWQALADRAIEPNPFSEPWMALPAMAAYPGDLRIVLVREASGAAIGVFPLERRRHLGRLPVPHLRTWAHPQMFLGTPCLEPSMAGPAWSGLLDWARGQGALLLDLSLLPRAGKAVAALRQAVPAAREVDTFARRVLRCGPGMSAEHYLAGAASARSLKTWRRQRRRLEEDGALELRRLAPDEAAAPWIEAFLALEASGWKGRDGTALICEPAEAAFFREAMDAAHRRGALHMLALHLDGRPVAMQCNLVSRGRGFAFKVAFDESHADRSPGALLELEAIADFAARPGLREVDSCARAGHPLMGRLWKDEIGIVRVLVPTGGRLGHAFCRAYPRLRRLARALR